YHPPPDGLPQSATIQSYDRDRNLASVALPDGRGLTVGYDFAGRVATIVQPEGTTTYVYDPTTGALASITSPDGVTTGYLRDGALVMRTTLSGAVAGRLDWTYDPSFRVATMTVQGTSPIVYGYDRDDLPIRAGDLTLGYRADNGLLESTGLGVVTDQRTYD